MSGQHYDWYHVTPLLVVDPGSITHAGAPRGIRCCGARAAKLVMDTDMVAIVATDELAAETLRLLGLTEAQVADRLHFGKTGEIRTP